MRQPTIFCGFDPRRYNLTYFGGDGQDKILGIFANILS
jgi:hypothetical protein